MIKFLIPSSFQINPSSVFPLVCLVVCFVHILTPRQDKLSAKATKCVFLSYSRLQRGYHYYPDTHQYFISADVTIFDNSSMFPTAHPPNSDIISLSLLYPISDTSFVPPVTPPRPLQIYTLCPRTNTEPPLTHLLWRPSPRRWSCRLLLIFPLPLGKILVPLVTLILFIISILITAYIHHILLFFPPCLMFLFLKLCMRPSPI